MISSLLRFIVIGFLGIVVLGVSMTVLGLALGIASVLLFKVAPLVLIGYFVAKLLSPKRKEISAEDRKWLEG